MGVLCLVSGDTFSFLYSFCPPYFLQDKGEGIVNVCPVLRRAPCRGHFSCFSTQEGQILADKVTVWPFPGLNSEAPKPFTAPSGALQRNSHFSKMKRASTERLLGAEKPIAVSRHAWDRAAKRGHGSHCLHPSHKHKLWAEEMIAASRIKPGSHPHCTQGIQG